MTPRRFAWLLAARGPDLSAWSPPDRTAALLLMRDDPGARTALADCLAADTLAAEDLPGHASDRAPERAADRAALLRMQAYVHRALAPPPPVLRGIRAGALAACIAIGLYLGLHPVDTDAAASSFASSVDGSVSATVLAALDP